MTRYAEVCKLEGQSIVFYFTSWCTKNLTIHVIRLYLNLLQPLPQRSQAELEFVSNKLPCSYV